MKHRVPLVPAALLAMLALLPAGTGAANPSYDPGASASRWVVTDLGNLGMANVTVSDINDRGQIVGEGATRDGLGRGFIWQDGSMTALGQGQFAAAHQINERGQIMGWSSIGWNSSVAFAEEHAVLWKNKRMIDLHGGTHIWGVGDQRSRPDRRRAEFERVHVAGRDVPNPLARRRSAGGQQPGPSRGRIGNAYRVRD